MPLARKLILASNLADLMALFVVTLSDNGKMSYSISSANDIISNPAFIRERLTLTFNELKYLTSPSANADRSI